MVLNPAGYVPVLDFGAPRIISGRAREAISGGQLVFCSGAAAAAVVSSGANSFNPVTDILFATGASGTNYVGIAIQTVGSNSSLSVATAGVHIITAAGTIVGGRTVVANGGDAVAEGTAAGTVIGRALCPAGSEGYVLVDLGGR